jgi:hypothetical protein
MVYDKKRSGDPDYDDKQPIEAHAGRIVKSADGRDVLMSDVLGPVDPATGEHVSLEVTAEDLDNRPAPGEVATQASEVQTYSVEDTPAADRPADAETGTAPAASAAADSKATTARPAKSTK